MLPRGLRVCLVWILLLAIHGRVIFCSETITDDCVGGRAWVYIAHCVSTITLVSRLPDPRLGDLYDFNTFFKNLSRHSSISGRRVMSSLTKMF